MREHISGLRVLVVGDVMLDEYWFGAVNRISPEAPVPIVKISQSDERPGGAANVARNVVALGAQATLLSVVGVDEAAVRLRNVLDAHGIRHCLQADESMRTTLKLRVVGHHQQMLRIDFEELPDHGSLDAVRSHFDELLSDHDVIVFSDYQKGVLDQISYLIEAVRDAGKPVVIDPKGDDYDRYTGATVITPNRMELATVAGAWKSEADMNAKAEALRVHLGLEKLLLTMSEQGMRLFGDDGILSRAPQAREVYDVSGAGDTVVASVAVMRGIGASWEDTVDFANTAGGIVVGKLGTSCATLDEVLAALPEKFRDDA